MWTVPEGKDEDAQINLKSENYPKLVSKCTKLLIMSHYVLHFFGYWSIDIYYNLTWKGSFLWLYSSDSEIANIMKEPINEVLQLAFIVNDLFITKL